MPATIDTRVTQLRLLSALNALRSAISTMPLSSEYVTLQAKVLKQMLEELERNNQPQPFPDDSQLTPEQDDIEQHDGIENG